jgi:acyl-[acyl-carrier-protein] desaturase
MDDAALLAELAPAAARLLERHQSTSHAWLPHELVPWARGGEQSSPALPAGVQSALIVNLLTEDNLPYYVLGLTHNLGQDGVWWEWIRRWTAEESRHGMVIRDYLSVTRLVDLDGLERARVAHMLVGDIPRPEGIAGTLVYLALQELSTRIAHFNTGACLDDPGRRIMQRVATDENLHHLFYRDLVSSALALDPSTVVVAMDREVRRFAMPGTSIPGFRDHSEAIAAAGIFSAATLAREVFHPSIVRQWRLPELTELDTRGEQARDRLMAFLSRLDRFADRLVDASDAVDRDDEGRDARS